MCKSVNLGVVGGVADDENAFGRDDARQAIEKTRGADSARQRHHEVSFHSPVILIPESFTL